MQRTVTSRIVLDVVEPAELVFAIAVSRHYALAEERMDATLDGAAVALEELEDAHGTRLHRIRSSAGRFVLDYRAVVDGEGAVETASDVDLLAATRPSRYAPSDALTPTAVAEFAGIEEPAERLRAVSSWVGTRLAYVSGSSSPIDGALETLRDRQGVCRDYAHLVVGLLRALDVPARLVAVYAPGLEPMDFHAVAEAWVDGAWHAVDATALAPRGTLVRIATGRDAADTAFLTTLHGRVDLLEMTVTATADALPHDDLDELVAIR